MMFKLLGNCKLTYVVLSKNGYQQEEQSQDALVGVGVLGVRVAQDLGQGNPWILITVAPDLLEDVEAELVFGPEIRKIDADLAVVDVGAGSAQPHPDLRSEVDARR